jgi:hypothetical protein
MQSVVSFSVYSDDAGVQVQSDIFKYRYFNSKTLQDGRLTGSRGPRFDLLVLKVKNNQVRYRFVLKQDLE